MLKVEFINYVRNIESLNFIISVGNKLSRISLKLELIQRFNTIMYYSLSEQINFVFRFETGRVLIIWNRLSWIKISCIVYLCICCYYSRVCISCINKVFYFFVYVFSCTNKYFYFSVYVFLCINIYFYFSWYISCIFSCINVKAYFVLSAIYY